MNLPQRHAAVRELRGRGFSQRRIAAELNISQTTVARDLKAIRRWQAEALRTVPLVTNWRDLAACRATDPEMFFNATSPVAVDAARAVCDNCPVIRECRDWATTHHINYGIWGGLTVKQRRQHRQRATA